MGRWLLGLFRSLEGLRFGMGEESGHSGGVWDVAWAWVRAGFSEAGVADGIQGCNVAMVRLSMCPGDGCVRLSSV